MKYVKILYLTEKERQWLRMLMALELESWAEDKRTIQYKYAEKFFDKLSK